MFIWPGWRVGPAIVSTELGSSIHYWRFTTWVPWWRLQSIDARSLFLKTLFNRWQQPPLRWDKLQRLRRPAAEWVDWTIAACGKRLVQSGRTNTFGPAPCKAHEGHRRGEPYRDHDRGGDQWRQDVLHSCFSARETDFLESLFSA